MAYVSLRWSYFFNDYDHPYSLPSATEPPRGKIFFDTKSAIHILYIVQVHKLKLEFQNYNFLLPMIFSMNWMKINITPNADVIQYLIVYSVIFN